jgi:hypothetical protein
MILFGSLAFGIALSFTRLLKKAHLLRWRAGYPSGRWVRCCGVRGKYASHRVPSLMGAHPCGWVPGLPPCIWTFLSGLGKDAFSGILPAS